MRTAVFLLLAASAAAHAATEQELKQAFEKAQKKGAVAVYEQRCGGTSTMYYPSATPASIAKTAAALAALAASGKGDSPADCAAGQHDGESRVLELYPDGTVKAR